MFLAGCVLLSAATAPTAASFDFIPERSSLIFGTTSNIMRLTPGCYVSRTGVRAAERAFTLGQHVHIAAEAHSSSRRNSTCSYNGKRCSRLEPVPKVYSTRGLLVPVFGIVPFTANAPTNACIVKRISHILLVPTPFESLFLLLLCNLEVFVMIMDMSSNSTMMMMMKPYFHFTPGDFLFFLTVQPRSIGAMVGACLVLFSLAFTERSLAAYVCIAEKKINNDLIKLSLAHKRPATSQYLAPKARLHGDEEEGDCESIMGIMGSTDSVQYHDNVVKPHPVPPFAFRIEIKRGMNRAASTVFHYALMLAVMSFNVGFILSVIAGLAVGEMTFARFAI